MKEFLKKEDGAYMVVEASIVFPIVFFVLLFLIYAGNMYFIRTSMESIAQEAATYGTRYANDGLYGDLDIPYGTKVAIPYGGELPIAPYRYYTWIGGKAGDTATAASMDLAEGRIRQLKSGYFSGMAPQGTAISATFTYGVIKNTMEVTIKYNLQFPIKMLFTPSKDSTSFVAVGVASASDAKDLMDTVNTVQDYAARSKFLTDFAGKFQNVLKFIQGDSSDKAIKGFFGK